MYARRVIFLAALAAVLCLGGCARVTGTAAPQQTPCSGCAPPVVPALADDWDDRSLFRAGLTPSAQGVLEGLPGASVYHIEVSLSADRSSLQGQERVRYTNNENQALDEIYFQLFPNMLGGAVKVGQVLVDGQTVQPAYEPGNTALRVPLPTALPPGQAAVLTLDFQVTVPLEAGGNYGLFGYINGILVLDGFYPSIPVYDAQGWHAGALPPNADTTFNDASFYLLRVTAPAELVLVASGVETERTEAGDWQTVTFACGPARDFYLAASDQFRVSSQQVGQTLVNSYAFKNRKAGSDLALETAAQALQIYGARLGAYPYTEFDVVSTPMQGATGIEYPGITGINQIVYDPQEVVSGKPAFEILESTVAHEVGHQWFYNLVGNDQANEPWLDEAVTQYITGLYFLDRYGPTGWASYHESWVSRWDRVNQEAMPIGLPAAAYTGREYGAIVYGRGPLFVEALAKQMGPEVFNAFLRDYVQAETWRVSSQEDFERQAEEHCQCDLTPLFNHWVNDNGGDG